MATAIRRIGFVGSPNSGKTTLFNAITGLRQKVANYAGVTVEHVESDVEIGDKQFTLIDLPGTYSLDALSPDESVTVQVLNGEMEGCDPLDAVVVVADATTLERSLQFVGEVINLGLSTILVVTMIDEMKARGGAIKIPALRRELGIPVVGVVGNKGIGIDDLKAVFTNETVWEKSPKDVPTEIEARYKWAQKVFTKGVTAPTEGTSKSDAIDKVLLHPVLGILTFVVVMFLFFQIVFAVAAPLQDLFEGGVAWLGSVVSPLLGEGLFHDLIIDGIIAGVGGVVVFVPQIALLLLMIAILESSGYMARAAFVIDRVMGWAGLEGRCFISLLSSYACAIPGIMATRGVPDAKTRIATIMSAPFMTCSARLPVYGLLIAAFVPAKTIGIFGLQGLVLFGLYALGSISALIAAALFRRGLKRGQTLPFYMELPPYRRPTFAIIFNYVWRGLKAFLKKAGTIILLASIVLWACLTFPRTEPPAEITGDDVAVASYQLEHSFAAQIGKTIEPVFEPLGFDWRINIGLVASFAAREVIVSTLAQIYAAEDEEDVEGLSDRLKAATDEDGNPIYTAPTVAALLIFFVYALQCVSTLAVMRRETGGWKWPTVAVGYMFVVAYVMAWLASVIVGAWVS